jgi:predicted RNase H-like HicB family nuclease
VDTPLIVELIPDPELGGFTARIPDIPAYGEGETEDEAIVDLKEALRAYIEAFGIYLLCDCGGEYPLPCRL